MYSKTYFCNNEGTQSSRFGQHLQQIQNAKRMWEPIPQIKWPFETKIHSENQELTRTYQNIAYFRCHMFPKTGPIGPMLKPQAHQQELN